MNPARPPKNRRCIDAVNIIQWTLYYPAILDPDELELSAGIKEALGPSLDAYRSGDLLQALAKYPEGRAAASESERVYHAALLLAVGQVDGAQQLLQEANRRAARGRVGRRPAGNDCVGQRPALDAQRATRTWPPNGWPVLIRHKPAATWPRL